MSTPSSTLSSPRNQRILLGIGLAVLVAGVVFLVVKLVGGSDSTSVQPSPHFKAVLPPKTTPLTTADGAKVTSYEQLPADVKKAIVGFVVPGVLHNNYGPSWKYTAPNITRGASQHRWATVDARSVIPLPGYTFDGVKYNLEEAVTKEILVVLRLKSTDPTQRSVPMRIGLVPYGKGAEKRWLVNYWMPATDNSKVPLNQIGS